MSEAYQAPRRIGEGKRGDRWPTSIHERVLFVIFAECACCTAGKIGLNRRFDSALDCSLVQPPLTRSRSRGWPGRPIPLVRVGSRCPAFSQGQLAGPRYTDRRCGGEPPRQLGQRHGPWPLVVTWTARSANQASACWAARHPALLVGPPGDLRPAGSARSWGASPDTGGLTGSEPVGLRQGTDRPGSAHSGSTQMSGAPTPRHRAQPALGINLARNPTKVGGTGFYITERGA